MSSSRAGTAVAARRSHSFDTTRWTLVVAAGDSQNPDSRRALASLCQTYWYPVYAYVRARGCDRPDAEDLTQGFFARLIEKHSLSRASRTRGRFRSFLLASLKHYLANEWHRGRARKRGGEQTLLRLDFEAAENRLAQEPATWMTPEHLYVQQWALSLLDTALHELGGEMRRKGREGHFAVLRDFLTGDESGVRYREAAARLAMSESAVRVAVHRLRKRFGKLLRSAVAGTVSAADEVEEEISSLLDSSAPQASRRRRAANGVTAGTHS